MEDGDDKETCSQRSVAEQIPSKCSTHSSVITQVRVGHSACVCVCALSLLSSVIERRIRGISRPL